MERINTFVVGFSCVLAALFAPFSTCLPADGFLQSGVPVTTQLPPRSFFNVAIEVPDGAEQLTVTLSNTTGDVDLYLKFGSEIAGTSITQIIQDADVGAGGGSGEETIVLTAASVPPLVPGIWYIAPSNTTFSTVGFTLTATVTGGAMPLPNEATVLPPYAAVVSPVRSSDPSKAKPAGFGSAAAKGNALNLHIGTGLIEGLADIYVGFHIPALDPFNIYLLTEDGRLQPLSQGLFPWKTGEVGPIDVSLFGAIPVRLLPAGPLTVYVVLIPTGNLSVFYMWSSTLVLGSDEDLVGEGVKLHRMTYSGEDSEIGRISAPLVKENLDFVFLNVVADLNGDGIFAPYETAGGMQQEEWLVRNAAVAVTQTRYSQFFPLVDPVVTEGSGVAVRVVLTRTALSEGRQWNGTVPGDGTSLDVTASVSVTDSPVLAAPAPNSVGGGMTSVTAFPRPLPGLNARMSPAPDLNTDIVFSRPDMTDALQGANTCVAHSIANSLDWLARKYGFEDKLKKPTDDIVGEPYDPGTQLGATALGFAVLDTYVDMGLFTQAKGIKGKDGETGFTHANENALKDNIRAGKDKFVADNKLPVETTILDDANGSKLFGLIKEALQDECTVEVVLRVTDEQGNDVGGHMVSVAGFSDIPPGQLGTQPHRTIVFHDPQTPETTRDLYNLGDDPSKITNFPFPGRDGKMKLRNAEIVFAVKECHKPIQTSCADLTGEYFAVVLDIPTGKVHIQFTGDPLTNNALHFEANSSVSIFGGPPFVNVTGEGTFSDGVCRFTAAGRGTVAGFPNVSVEMTGTVSTEGISGIYTMGAGGELPGGEPITFVFE